MDQLINRGPVDEPRTDIWRGLSQDYIISVVFNLLLFEGFNRIRT